MKQNQTWRWVPAAALLAMMGTSVKAEEAAAKPSDTTGQNLTCTAGGTTNCRMPTVASPTAAKSGTAEKGSVAAREPEVLLLDMQRTTAKSGTAEKGSAAAGESETLLLDMQQRSERMHDFQRTRDQRLKGAGDGGVPGRYDYGLNPNNTRRGGTGGVQGDVEPNREKVPPTPPPNP